MTLGDGGDNPSLAGLIREFAGCPMADGTSRRLRGSTGQGDDLAPLLGAEGGRRPWSWGILKTLLHRTSRAFEPVATAAPDCGACGAEATCHDGGREPLRYQQDNLGPEAQMLGCLMGPDHRVEDVALL